MGRVLLLALCVSMGGSIPDLRLEREREREMPVKGAIRGMICPGGYQSCTNYRLIQECCQACCFQSQSNFCSSLQVAECQRVEANPKFSVVKNFFGTPHLTPSLARPEESIQLLKDAAQAAEMSKDLFKKEKKRRKDRIDKDGAIIERKKSFFIPLEPTARDRIKSVAEDIDVLKRALKEVAPGAPLPEVVQEPEEEEEEEEIRELAPMQFLMPSPSPSVSFPKVSPKAYQQQQQQQQPPDPEAVANGCKAKAKVTCSGATSEEVNYSGKMYCCPSSAVDDAQQVPKSEKQKQQQQQQLANRKSNQQQDSEGGGGTGADPAAEAADCTVKVEGQECGGNRPREAAFSNILHCCPKKDALVNLEAARSHWQPQRRKRPERPRLFGSLREKMGKPSRLSILGTGLQ